MVSAATKALVIKRSIIDFYEGIEAITNDELAQKLQLLRSIYFQIKENPSSQILTNFRTLFSQGLARPWRDLPDDIINKLYDDNLLFLSSDVERVLIYFIKKVALTYTLKNSTEHYDLYVNFLNAGDDYNIIVDNITISLSSKIRLYSAENVSSCDLLLPLEFKKNIFERKPISYKKFLEYVNQTTVLQIPELYIFNNLV
uniref:P23 n=1 Tax=Olive leaf mottling virus TaxID=3162628 RepID=A0AAU7NKA6_9CLOS